MNRPNRILLIEDDPGIRETLQRVLTEEGHQVAVEGEGDKGLARATAEPFNLVVTYLRLPGLSGMQVVQELHRLKPRLPIILITAFGSTETAIQATKLGAYDYIQKPFNIPDLLEILDKAADTARLSSSPVEVGHSNGQGEALIGHSEQMQAVYKHIGRVASKTVNVLLLGETGTGKELIARAIFQYSQRANGPFVAINCAAIPETLLESELFGHERGAFTGADARRIGRFEQANKGTIFLDEIGDMTLGTQAKLLRVLQERCIQRLGGKETVPVDVRVIAATHRDLDAAMKVNQFRQDLYYRLSVVVISLPPLRHRRQDIPDLVHFFMRKYGPEVGNEAPAIHPEAIELLNAQSWPGNVRELENVVRKSLLLAQNFTVNQEHVRAALTKTPGLNYSPHRAFGDYIDDVIAAARREELTDVYDQVIGMAEQELLVRSIEQAQGNQARAARWLGISRNTLKAKLIQFGLYSRTNGDELAQ